MKKLVAAIIILLVVGVGIGGYVAIYDKPANKNDQQTQETTQEAVNDSVKSTLISYEGQEGKTALELLKTSHQVTEEQYSFGAMVKSIDSLEADSKHFWGFYVNGSMAQMGADAYVTKGTDQIEWKYEEIK